MLSHSAWQRGFRAAAAQKTFKVLDPSGRDNQVHEIDIMMLQDQAAAGESAAEQTGFTVDVRYSAAPDQVLFTKTFPTQDMAQKVMDDLSQASAEVEGLIRQTDFEGARTAMQALGQLFKSSTSETPVEQPQGGGR